MDLANLDAYPDRLLHYRSHIRINRKKKGMRKAVISRNFGAGWSTWADDNKAQQVAEYKPIIEYIENGGDPSALDTDHPLIVQMMKDLEISYFYCGGALDLKVIEVTPPYRIMEFDGAEYIIIIDDLWT